VFASFSGGSDSDGTFVAVLLIFIVLGVVYYYTRPRWYNHGRGSTCCSGSKRASRSTRSPK
jgi:Na+-translocating ferredoxin:NAD+ oxidoreductase RnfD subunit